MEVCFVVPAHGRIRLAQITLRRLGEVCSELDATAVVVAVDENLTAAHAAGLQTIRRDNLFLGRKFNDGLQHAAGVADYVIPLGNDDLISPDLVRSMLEAARGVDVVCTQRMAAVAPTGQTLAELRIPYVGGAGPRLIPSALLHRCGGRPADDTRQRALDTSIKRGLGSSVVYRSIDSHPLALVDLKTEGSNLNTFEALLPYQTAAHADVWEKLAEHHPAATVNALRHLYERTSP